MSRLFTRKGRPLVVLGAFGLFSYAMLAGCSVRSEQPAPPQQPAQTFVNNMPPSNDNSGFLVMITVLGICLVGAAVLVVVLGGLSAWMHKRRKEALAELADWKDLAKRHNLATALNGEMLRPSLAAASVRTPYPQPQAQMLESGR